MGIIGLVAAVGILASACVAMPSDSSWGDVSLLGDPPKILLAFSDRVVQVDPTDGSPVELRDANGNVRTDDQGNPRTWLVQSPSGTTVHYYSRPVQTDPQTLTVAAYENKLYQIDLSSANILSADGINLPGHVVGNPLLTDKFLYVPLSDAGLVALDPKSFAQKWQFTGDDGKGVWAQPLLSQDGSTLYVPTMNHKLFAIDAQTGTEKWNVDLDGAVASTPVFANGALYVGSFGRKVFKVTTDGTIAASFDTSDWVWGAPAVVDNMVYAADLSGYVYALEDDGSSFKQVWSRQVAQGAIRMTPLVSGDTIVVGSRDQNVYWISRQTGDALNDSSGKPIIRQMQGEVLSNILLIPPSGSITEPMIIVSTIAKQEELVAFTLATGERRWAYNGS